MLAFLLTLVPNFQLALLIKKREVDMGPFKHKVDDALPLRKAAISIFASCLEKCPTALDVAKFMPVLAKALGDVEDIQLQSHQILISLCNHHPLRIVEAVESFVEPLEKTTNKKLKNKSGTELERAKEWVKSALRVMIVLSKVRDVMK